MHHPIRVDREVVLIEIFVGRAVAGGLSGGRGLFAAAVCAAVGFLYSVIGGGIAEAAEYDVSATTPHGQTAKVHLRGMPLPNEVVATACDATDVSPVWLYVVPLKLKRRMKMIGGPASMIFAPALADPVSGSCSYSTGSEEVVLHFQIVPKAVTADDEWGFWVTARTP
jgi:hypothetical protein